jgi:hypothetical protein
MTKQTKVQNWQHRNGYLWTKYLELQINALLHSPAFEYGIRCLKICSLWQRLFWFCYKIRTRKQQHFGDILTRGESRFALIVKNIFGTRCVTGARCSPRYTQDERKFYIRCGATKEKAQLGVIQGGRISRGVSAESPCL